MSLTGTPLIRVPTFLAVNPRTVTRESPAPPPCSDAYTPGTVSRAIGMSLDASRSCISALVTVVNATGARSSDLEETTSTWDKPKADTASEKLTVSEEPLTVTDLDWSE